LNQERGIIQQLDSGSKRLQGYLSCLCVLCAESGCPSHPVLISKSGVSTIFRQFRVSLCPVAVHRELHPFKKGKMARCGWVGGRGGSFFIINGRDGFRFFRALLFQKRLRSITDFSPDI
ncbi:hypothetical protein T07_380, partial [Trichinella nelsoni]